MAARSHPFLTGLALGAAAVLYVEGLRLLGWSPPVPFLVLFASTVVGGVVGGLKAGLAAGVISSTYILYSALIGFGPATLTGGPVQVAIGMALMMGTGAGLGGILDRERRALASSERRVRRQLAELKHVYNTAPVGLCLMDHDLRFLRINERMAEINGRPPEEHIGRTLHEVVPELAESVEPIYRKVLASGKPLLGFEVQGRTPADPRRRWWLVSYFPQTDTRGRVLGVSTVVQDMTERKRLEETLLEISDRERRRMGRDLHDTLGQVLAGTRYMAGALEQRLRELEPGISSDMREIVEQLDVAIVQAKSISEGLSPVSLLGGGLPTALESLAVGFRHVFGVDCSFDNGFQGDIDDVEVATHLYRIGQEALNNSVKHSDPKELRVSLVGSPSSGTLTIVDDGVGIPNEVTDPMADEGGMGLHIMRQRAALIGGTLRVRRRHEGGTAVTCHFTLDKVAGDELALADIEPN